MSQTLLIISIVAVYLIVWMVFSFRSGKGADNSTFFSGGRKMPWPLVAIAMLGAPITGVTLISVPGMVVGKGFSYLQMCLGFVVGYAVIAAVLVPLYYKLNIVSIYSFLERRFGHTSSKTGAWLFFFSKIFGISVRFLMVCAMLQFLVFDPLGVPYIVSVITGLALIWLSTYKGGVKSVIWGDSLKSICLLLTIGLCIYFICRNLGLSGADLPGVIAGSGHSRVFHFDNPGEGQYFWKQFVAGIFIVIAMTGLDQDMMQRSLACRSPRDSRKNLMVGSVLQIVVISLLLTLGLLMTLYVEANGVDVTGKSDNLFATVAFHDGIPVIVGALFILGLISATLPSVASALTAMTTSVSVDILETDRAEADEVSRRRKWAHTLICITMALLVIFFYYLNEEDAISTVYTIVSYTDGPILGLFLFGILTRRSINERWLPAVCILAPVISWAIQTGVNSWSEYEISYELLLINAGLTMAGLYILSARVTRLRPKTSLS